MIDDMKIKTKYAFVISGTCGERMAPGKIHDIMQSLESFMLTQWDLKAEIDSHVTDEVYTNLSRTITLMEGDE